MAGLPVFMAVFPWVLQKTFHRFCKQLADESTWQRMIPTRFPEVVKTLGSRLFKTG